MILQKGDRVTYSQKWLEQYRTGNIVRYKGRMGTVASRPRAGSPMVSVIWDGTKNPIRFHAGFIDFVEPPSIDWNEIRSAVTRQFEKTLEYLGETERKEEMR